PCSVLDVNVDDMVADMGPEFPGILPRPGLRSATVGIENGIRRIENPLEPGNILNQLERVPPAHTAEIHAVLVDGLDAGIEKAFSDLSHAMEYLGWRFLVRVSGFIAHDPNELALEALHAGDRPVNFSERGLERIGDFLGPVGDR